VSLLSITRGRKSTEAALEEDRDAFLRRLRKTGSDGADGMYCGRLLDVGCCDW